MERQRRLLLTVIQSYLSRKHLALVIDDVWHTEQLSRLELALFFWGDGHFVAVDSIQNIVYSLDHPVEGTPGVLDDAPLFTGIRHHIETLSKQRNRKECAEMQCLTRDKDQTKSEKKGNLGLYGYLR